MKRKFWRASVSFVARYLRFGSLVTTTLVYKAKVESLGSSLLHDESLRFTSSAKLANLCDQQDPEWPVKPFLKKDSQWNGCVVVINITYMQSKVRSECFDDGFWYTNALIITSCSFFKINTNSYCHSTNNAKQSSHSFQLPHWVLPISQTVIILNETSSSISANSIHNRNLGITWIR